MRKTNILGIELKSLSYLIDSSLNLLIEDQSDQNILHFLRRNA